MTSLPEEMQRAEQLVRTLEEQQRAEEQAEQRGIQFALEVFAKYAPEIWEAGRADMEREVNAAWAEVAARARCLGSPESRTHEEQRGAELEACKPRPGDFLGVARDPGYIDRCRASMEARAHNNHQRAA